MFSFGRRTGERQISDRIRHARRTGEGVYLEEWRFVDTPSASQPTPRHMVVDPVIVWCRETLAGTRRPWGIGQFDLAIAVRHARDGTVRSLSLTQLAPTDLYPGDSLVEEIARFLEAERDTVAHLAVALFSWGDAAHASIPTQP